MLQGHIGQAFEVQGSGFQVVEVLDGELAAVVQQTGGRDAVQENLYGDPRRRVPRTHTIPLIADDGQSVHPLMRHILTDAEGRRIEAFLSD